MLEGGGLLIVAVDVEDAIVVVVSLGPFHDPLPRTWDINDRGASMMLGSIRVRVSTLSHRQGPRR